MSNPKESRVISILLPIAIVISSLLFSNAFMHRYRYNEIVKVKGSAKTDFECDLIVWQASISAKDTVVQNAYEKIQIQRDIVSSYLEEAGLTKEEFIFTAIDMNKETSRHRDKESGAFVTSFLGYTLKQDVEITSDKVDKIEEISRDITSLLDKEVTIQSSSPRYFNTKLSDLKLDLVAKATENAKKRAETIAENTESQLGKLVSSKLGIFQILAQNTVKGYSWGGAYNTTSRYKTARVTVDLKYKIK